MLVTYINSKICALAAAALLTGCSTNPDSFTYVPAPASSVLSVVPEVAPGPDVATLSIRHEPAFNDWQVNYFFLIDGRQIARLETGEELAYRVRPGDYNLGVMCNSALVDAKNQAVTTVRPAQAYRVRLYATTYSVCNIEVTKLLPGSAG